MVVDCKHSDTVFPNLYFFEEKDLQNAKIIKTEREKF